MAFAFDDQDDDEFDRLQAWLAIAVEGLGLNGRLARWRAPWRDQAACRASGVDFYDRRQEPAARALCGACGVRSECLDAGRQEPDGLWGGLDRAERRARGKTGGADPCVPSPPAVTRTPG